LKIIVTGGSGFTGRRVVSRLVARGDDVVGLARSSTAADCLIRLGATPIGGDLDDPESIDEAFRLAGAPNLVNLASLGFGHAGSIIAAAEEAGINRAVFVSTTAIFTTLAAPSKSIRLEAEAQVRSSGLDWTIVRPTMIYGAPGDRNMSRLLGVLRRARAFPLPGGGHRLQQPVHVDDLADAIVACFDAPVADGQTYDLAGPEALPFRTLVEQAAAAVDRRARLVPVPLAPVIGALRLYERIIKDPKIKSEQLERLAEDKAFDIGPARRDLGYAPRSFEVGIRAEAAQLL